MNQRYEKPSIPFDLLEGSVENGESIAYMKISYKIDTTSMRLKLSYNPVTC
jgi:hypothetical protein